MVGTGISNKLITMIAKATKAMAKPSNPSKPIGAVASWVLGVSEMTGKRTGI